MDCPRHRFAAGPALAEHEHVAAARGDAAHQGQHVADGRRRAEHAAGRQFQRRRRLGPRFCRRVRELAGIADGGAQILLADGPGDEIGDAEPQRLRRRVRLASIGDADDRDVGANDTRTQETQRLGTGEIQDDDEVGVWLLVEGGADLGRLFETRDGVAAPFQHLGETLPLSGVGGDQENRRGRAHFTRTCFV